MDESHPFVDKCKEKGKDVEFFPGSGGTIFDHEDGYVVYQLDYRDEFRTIVVKCETNVPWKRFWNRMLRQIREEKRYADLLWEHGYPLPSGVQA